MRGHKEGVPTIGPRSKALRETKAVPNFLPGKLLLRHHLNNASIVSSIIKCNGFMVHNWFNYLFSIKVETFAKVTFSDILWWYR